jgi:nucleoside-triphosphatase THEP1
MHRNVHIVTRLERDTVIHDCPDVWILTGDRNSGKTTQIQTWAAWNTAEGLCISGVLSEKVLVDGTVMGYDVVEIGSGMRHPIIRVFPSTRSRMVGRFYFDEEGFNRVNAALLSAPSGDIGVLDEIGIAEMGYREGLYPALEYFTGLEIPLVLCVRKEIVENVCDFIQANTQVPKTS